eukprot:m51a1_g2867 hypothetical protein (496) ;mRNA; r:357365-358925
MEGDDHLFLGENWGLDSRTARELWPYAQSVRGRLGIIDAHTHLSARQIVEDELFPDPLAAMLRNTDARWPNYDHYLGQALAAAGLPHSALLAPAPAYDPASLWARAAALFPTFAGNHAYTWAHLELARTFGVRDVVSAASAARIWDAASARVRQEDMRPRALLRRAGVRLLCTTDDPLDDLAWIERARAEVAPATGTHVLPAFRPDNVTNVLKPGWRAYVGRLLAETGQEATLDGLCEALRQRHEYFERRGCRLSDHGLSGAYGRRVADDRAQELWDRAFRCPEGLAQDPLSAEDEADWASWCMHRLAALNKASGWVTLIHFGAFRGANTELVRCHGADVGADTLARSVGTAQDVAPLLSRFCGKGDGTDLRVVLAPIDPGTYAEVVGLTRAFAGVSQMAPWWFSDTHATMVAQIEHHIEHGFVASYFGMVCDGRKLTSIAPRFEMYDRAVCCAVGHMVERGIVPRSVAQSMVHKLVYGNQARHLGFPEDSPLVL